jgi:hypothetical protein
MEISCAHARAHRRWEVAVETEHSEGPGTTAPPPQCPPHRNQ